MKSFSINEKKSIINEIIIKLKTQIFSNIKYDHILNIPLLILELVSEVTKKYKITDKEKYTYCREILEHYLVYISKHTEDEKESVQLIFNNLIEIYNNLYKKKINFQVKTIRKSENNTILVSENLYNRLVTYMLSDEPDISFVMKNFIKYVLYVIININEYKDLCGFDKKEIVLHVINRFVDDVKKYYSDIDEYQFKVLEYINYELAIIIDNIFRIIQKKSNL